MTTAFVARIISIIPKEFVAMKVGIIPKAFVAEKVGIMTTAFVAKMVGIIPKAFVAEKVGIIILILDYVEDWNKGYAGCFETVILATACWSSHFFRRVKSIQNSKHIQFKGQNTY